jgi:hypothetical protein
MGMDRSISKDLQEIFGEIRETGSGFWRGREPLPIDELPEGTMKTLLEILDTPIFLASIVIKDFTKRHDYDCDMPLESYEVQAVENEVWRILDNRKRLR